VIKVKSVKVDQAEGETGKMICVTVPTIDEACSALRRVMYQCPEDMLGYLKTDVVIEWEDGSRHGFRADVNQHGDNTNLTLMLRRWAEGYKAGATRRNLKCYMTPEQVKEAEDHAARILLGELEVL
jgi:hypothetical protein